MVGVGGLIAVWPSAPSVQKLSRYAAAVGKGTVEIVDMICEQRRTNVRNAAGYRRPAQGVVSSPNYSCGAGEFHH